MASGMWESFMADLRAVQPDGTDMLLLQRVTAAGSADDREALLTSLQACKSGMLYRCLQAWSFWQCFPWKVLRLGAVFLPNHDCHACDASQACSIAADLLSDYDRQVSKASLGMVSAAFLGQAGALRSDMVNLAAGSRMSKNLKCRLLGYSTALIVMQRLEAKRHYLNMVVGRGRAVQPPALVAEMRRRANKDCQCALFRKELPTYLDSFSELAPFAWHSWADLLQLVYGYGLSQMHPDISTAEDKLKRFQSLVSSWEHDCSNTLPGDGANVESYACCL